MTPAEMAGTGPLVLVNRSHPLEREPDAASLLPPDSRRPDIRLDTRASTVLSRFLSDLGCAGEIVPVSGYRSRAEQEAIFADSLRDNGEAFTMDLHLWYDTTKTRGGFVSALGAGEEFASC